jgi:hypothetical protein
MQLRRITTLVFLLLLLLGIGCRQRTSGEHPIQQRLLEPTPPPLEDELVVVSLAELAAVPADYVGQRVQVTGAFERLTPLTCLVVTRRSPASWQLSDGEATILVDGKHEQLARLAPNGLAVALTGRWWVWEGFVGCGKNAPRQRLYYLQLGHVLDPNPITNATLTPAPDAVTPTTEPPPLPSAPSATPPPTTTPTIAGPTPSPTPSPSPDLTGTPTGTLSGSPAPTQSATPTVAATATVMGTPATGATPSTSPTVDPKATATVTPLPSQTLPAGAPTATASPQTVLKGELETQDLVIEAIDAGVVHQWDFVAEASTVLTINVASRVETNMTVLVRPAGGQALLVQDEAQDGEPEIAVVDLPDAGTYEVVLSVEDGAAGTYALLLADAESYAFAFRGTLVYGDAGSAEMAPETDHFWHFWGEAGDRIALLAAPNDQSDLFMELYGPDATLLLDNPVDEGGAGVPEALLNYELSATGLYAVRVGEFNFKFSDYTLTLEDATTQP